MCLKQHKLREIWFYLCSDTPDKNPLPAAVRRELLQLAIADYPGMKILCVPTRTTTTTTTAGALQALSDCIQMDGMDGTAKKNDVVVILGTDTFESLPRWKKQTRCRFDS